MSSAGDQSVATGGRILEVHYALRPAGRTRVARSRQLPTFPRLAVGRMRPVTRVYQCGEPSTSRLHSGTRAAHARSPTTKGIPRHPNRKDLKNQTTGLDRSFHISAPSYQCDALAGALPRRRPPRAGRPPEVGTPPALRCHAARENCRGGRPPAQGTESVDRPGAGGAPGRPEVRRAWGAAARADPAASLSRRWHLSCHGLMLLSGHDGSVLALEVYIE